jgi:hypothetical protein
MGAVRLVRVGLGIQVPPGSLSQDLCVRAETWKGKRRRLRGNEDNAGDFPLQAMKNLVQFARGRLLFRSCCGAVHPPSAAFYLILPPY